MMHVSKGVSDAFMDEDFPVGVFTTHVRAHTRTHSLSTGPVERTR